MFLIRLVKNRYSQVTLLVTVTILIFHSGKEEVVCGTNVAYSTPYRMSCARDQAGLRSKSE